MSKPVTNYQGALQNFPLALLISASLANAKVSNEDCNGWTILIVFIGHCNKSTTKNYAKKYAIKLRWEGYWYSILRKGVG